MSRVDHVPRRATELGVPSRPHLLVFASWSFGGSGVGGGGGVSCGRSSPSSPPTGQGSMVRGQDGESGGVAWCGLALLACVYPSTQSAHPSCESLSTSGTSYVEFSAATSRNVDGGRRRTGGGVGRNTELEERQETNVVARQRPIQGQRGDGVSEEGAWCGLARRVRPWAAEPSRRYHALSQTP
ncbi:hypothetical protein B0H13DRAFT_372230 [Mycena leptocephala]|nr:hypothetical protein B0H13DRAFT_372230 [Mycena leptocephala]